MNFIGNDLCKFIDKLPDIYNLKPPACHLLMLGARSRGTRELMSGLKKNHDIMVERVVIRPYKDWRNVYYEKLMKLITLQHYGRYFIDEQLIPNVTLAIFATMTPRNVAFAAVDLSKRINESFYKIAFSEGDSGANETLQRLDLEFFSALHSHAHNIAKFKTIDIDDAELYEDALEIVKKNGIEPYLITKPARGYHIIVRFDQTTDKDIARRFFEPGGVWETIHSKYGEKIHRQDESQEPMPGTMYYKSGYTIENPNYVQIVEA